VVVQCQAAFPKRDGLLAGKFQTAAYADGVVHFGAQDMHIYAVSAKDGKRSERFSGASMDYWFPAVHKGKVIVTTMQPPSVPQGVSAPRRNRLSSGPGRRRG